MEDRCLKCPESPDGDGFLQHGAAGGLRSESSGVSVSEGPFVQIPPETGSVELKGFVSSDADLPENPRPGWMVIADRPGVYAGVSLSAGDALVCTGTNPPVWLAFAGSSMDIDASRLTGTASVDTTGNAATADKVNHGFAVTGPGGQALAFDGSASAGIAVGGGLSLTAAGTALPGDEDGTVGEASSVVFDNPPTVAQVREVSESLMGCWYKEGTVAAIPYSS